MLLLKFGLGKHPKIPAEPVALEELQIKISLLGSEIEKLRKKPVPKIEGDIPFATPAFVCDTAGRIVACSQGSTDMMKQRVTGRVLAGELVEPVTAEPLKKALKAAWGGQDTFHVKTMFIAGDGQRITILVNVFSGLGGNAEVIHAGEDPFACLWEKEEDNKRWTPLGKVISLQLEESIALGDDCVQTGQRTKEEASTFIRARVSTSLRTGKNMKIRRQRPRLVYDSIAPTADYKYGIAAKMKEHEAEKSTPRSTPRSSR